MNDVLRDDSVQAVSPSDSMSESFDDLRAGLREGDHDSARELFTRFATRLVALARSRMDGQLKHKVDPEDVV